MYEITTSGLSFTFSFDNNSVNITFNFNQNSTAAKVLLSQLVASHISVLSLPLPGMLWKGFMCYTAWELTRCNISLIGFFNFIMLNLNSLKWQAIFSSFTWSSEWNIKMTFPDFHSVASTISYSPLRISSFDSAEIPWSTELYSAEEQQQRCHYFIVKFEYSQSRTVIQIKLTKSLDIRFILPSSAWSCGAREHLALFSMH